MGKVITGKESEALILSKACCEQRIGVAGHFEKLVHEPEAFPNACKIAQMMQALDDQGD